MISHQDAPDECFSHKSSHLDISEDPLRALMGRVYDPAKNAPSQASPIIARDVLFFPCHRRGWQTFSFLGWKVLSTAAPQSSCHGANITVKIFSLTKKMCLLSRSRWRRLFLWLHTCLRSGLLLVTSATWSSFFFFYQTGLFFPVIPPSGAALILSHDRFRCMSTH